MSIVKKALLLAVLSAAVAVPAFAQTPVPTAISFEGAVQALTNLGVLPVIVLGAIIFMASRLYKMFRK